VAQQLTAPASNLSPDTFLGLWIELRNLKRAMEEAHAKYRAHRKKLDKAGVNLKGLALAETFANLDQDEADQRLKDAVRYSRWAKLPLGAQPDLLSELLGNLDAPGEKASHELTKAEAEEQGYDYGKRGEDRGENPHDQGTELWASWDSGWIDGQTQIAQGLAAPKSSKRNKPKARNIKLVHGSRLGV
jgi:hypothetical protein